MQVSGIPPSLKRSHWLQIRHLTALKLLLICLSVLAASIHPLSASQGIRKLALVVGNNAYVAITPLSKSRNDASAITRALKENGFDVTEAADLTRRDMNIKIAQLAAAISPGDTVLFYFSGHGVSLDGTNYLLPVDMPLLDGGGEAMVRSEAVATEQIIADFQSKGARVTLIILDACRNNPFPPEGTKGLKINASVGGKVDREGVFVLYSAGMGQQSLENLGSTDSNPNSVFTRSLVPLLYQKKCRHECNRNNATRPGWQACKIDRPGAAPCLLQRDR